jgi:GNAT superfamily N-acetyltransferase
MTPDEFAETVRDAILEANNQGYMDAQVSTDVGSVGVYLPPDNMIHDFYIEESMRGSGYGRAGLHAAVDALERIQDGTQPVITALIRQTIEPDVSYADSERTMEDDPTFKLLVSAGFTSISEVKSAAVDGEYAFEARLG